jgi:fructose-specific PTS system IIA-like component
MLAVLSAETGREWLEKSMCCSTVAEVNTLLSQITAAFDEPFLETELIVLDSGSATKEEAIRELVNALYVSGRTDDPSAVEEAIWAREAMGVTGVGFGFGVPHCKSNAMRTHSIGIVRLRQPVSWNLEKDEPVQMIILLALRQSGSSDLLHMKIFSKLARRLMHDGFRQQLLEAGTMRDIVLFLEKELDL